MTDHRTGLGIKHLKSTLLCRSSILIKSAFQDTYLNGMEEGMATYSSTLASRIPWTKEPGRLQSILLQRVGHDWSDLAHTHTSQRHMCTRKMQIKVNWSELSNWTQTCSGLPASCQVLCKEENIIEHLPSVSWLDYCTRLMHTVAVLAFITVGTLGLQSCPSHKLKNSILQGDLDFSPGSIAN